MNVELSLHVVLFLKTVISVQSPTAVSSPGIKDKNNVAILNTSCEMRKNNVSFSHVNFLLEMEFRVYSHKMSEVRSQI